MKDKIFQDIEEFNKKILVNEKLGLDERDNKIISLLQKDPGMSQAEIGQIIRLSQPSVGGRLSRLRKKGVLNIVQGVNFRVVDLSLAKIDVYATDTKAVIDEFNKCPFFLNALITSGRYNICFFFMATDLKRLEGIVNHHLRNNPKVKDVELNIVISTQKDFVMPMNIDFDNKDQLACPQDCRCI